MSFKVGSKAGGFAQFFEAHITGHAFIALLMDFHMLLAEYVCPE